MLSYTSFCNIGICSRSLLSSFFLFKRNIFISEAHMVWEVLFLKLEYIQNSFWLIFLSVIFFFLSFCAKAHQNAGPNCISKNSEAVLTDQIRYPTELCACNVCVSSVWRQHFTLGAVCWKAIEMQRKFIRRMCLRDSNVKHNIRHDSDFISNK